MFCNIFCFTFAVTNNDVTNNDMTKMYNIGFSKNIEDKHLSVPVQLFSIAIEKNISRELKLFLFLKIYTSGHFKLSNTFIDYACYSLDYKSPKTLKKHLDSLLKLKWITLNSKSGSYRIIGFAQLSRKLKITSSKSVEFRYSNLKTFSGFVAAVTITYLMMVKSLHEKRSREKKWSRSKSRCPFLYHLPLTYMSKCLSINKSKVQRLRKEAVNASYILVTKNFYFTKVPLEQVNNFKKYSDKKINDGFIRIINKQVMLQKPDYIKSNLVFYKKRSLRFVHSCYGKK